MYLHAFFYPINTSIQTEIYCREATHLMSLGENFQLISPL